VIVIPGCHLTRFILAHKNALQERLVSQKWSRRISCPKIFSPCHSQCFFFFLLLRQKWYSASCCQISTFETWAQSFLAKQTWHKQVLPMDRVYNVGSLPGSYCSLLWGLVLHLLTLQQRLNGLLTKQKRKNTWYYFFLPSLGF